MSGEGAWVDWLAESGYGIDWRADVDPPCSLADIAGAYTRLPDGEGETVETMAWCITEETGEWGRGHVSAPSQRPGALAYAQMVAEQHGDLDDAAVEDGMDHASYSRPDVESPSVERGQS